MKKYFLVLVLLVFIFPSVTLAAWWNPLSWFHNWTFKSYDINEIIKNTPSPDVKLKEVSTTTVAKTTNANTPNNTSQTKKIETAQQKTTTNTQQNSITTKTTTSQTNSSWVTDPTTPINPNLIEWSTTRKLTWSDFRGTPIYNIPEAAAVTPSLNIVPTISHKCDTQNGVTTCTFRLDAYKLTTVMDPTKSWVNLNLSDNFLLSHEQIHFDIAELFARKLKIELDSKIGKTITQKADSPDYIIKAYQTLLGKDTQDEMQTAQSLYDSDTDHGSKVANQNAWANCVATWLATNSPFSTCQMPAAVAQNTYPTPYPTPYSTYPTPYTTPYPTPYQTPVVTCTPTNNSGAPIATTNSTGSITITSPNGGECITKGSSKTITWTSGNTIDKVTISYISSTGTYNTIASNISNNGSYTWSVNVGNTTNTQYKIEIIGYQTGVGSVIDDSDNFFTVY